MNKGETNSGISYWMDKQKRPDKEFSSGRLQSGIKI